MPYQITISDVVNQPYDVYKELAVIGGSHTFFVHHNISALVFSIAQCNIAFIY